MSTKKTTSFDQLRALAVRTKSELDALQGAMPTKVSDLTNDSNFQTETQVDAKISAAVAGSLQPGGSVTFANLPALNATNCNHIYNVEDAFTTTSDFKEGAGVDYPAGTNVAIINVGTKSSPVYKYDAYTGTFDFSGFATKVTGGTTGNFAGLDANGNIVDSGRKASDFLTQHQDISGKADKVTGGTENNFAALDANGNPKDSGKKAADFVAAESGKRLMTDAEGTKLDGISAGATKTEASNTNGNIKIDGTETTVYTLPDTVLQDSNVATDSEVTTMLNEVFGTPSGN